jgi:hypothetical protein
MITLKELPGILLHHSTVADSTVGEDRVKIGRLQPHDGFQIFPLMSFRKLLILVFQLSAHIRIILRVARYRG